MHGRTMRTGKRSGISLFCTLRPWILRKQPFERPSFGSSDLAKPKKIGRPKLPKGEAKGRIVPVRFNAEDLKAIEASAKRSKQTVSEWIRSTLNTALRA